MNANDAGRMCSQFAGLSHRSCQLLDGGPHPLKQSVAGLRQRNTPGIAMEQPDADALFESTNHLAER